MKHFFLPLCLLVLFFASCSVYSPKTTGIPLLTQKGEARLEGSVSCPFPSGGFSFGLTGAKAFSDHFSGQFNITSDPQGSIFGQVAAGLYTTQQSFVVEGFAGAGLGFLYGEYRLLRNEDITSERYHTTTYEGGYQIYFGQVNLGWVDLAKGHIDVGLGLRGGFFQPHFTRLREYPNDPSRSSEVTENQGGFLTEPLFLFRVGGPSFKVSLNLGFANISNFNNKFFYYDIFTATLGLNYRIFPYAK